MRGPRLHELPPPPPGKTGWPWTVETPPFSGEAVAAPSKKLPCLSVVVPSYQQGEYLEENIRSILLQNYTAFELIVMDGGSTDTTRNVLERYSPWITFWVIEKDRGQSHAINKGFERVSGDLIAWQNSDDYFKPGVFQQAAKAALANPGDDVFYGDVEVVTADSRFDHHRPGAEFDLFAMFPWPCVFNQAFFFRRSILEKGHRIEERWKHHMDQNFFWALILADYRFRYVKEIGGCFRIHDQAKGATQFRIASVELFDLFERLLREQRFSAALKDKIFASMQGLVMDNYIKRELDLFRSSYFQLIRLRGLAGMNLDLSAKFVLSWFGPGFLDWLNSLQIKQRLRRTALKGSRQSPT